MGLSAATEWATFDDSNAVRLDISDVLSAILLVDDNFLASISPTKRALDTTHYWIEDSLVSNQVVQADGDPALNDSDTSLVVTTDQGVRLRVGSLLRDTAAGSNEVMQVTAISTDTLTITRGFGNTSGETHLAGATFRIVSQPKQEGADTQNSLSVAKTRRTNYTGIFERGLSLTESYIARPQVAPQDFVKWEVHKKLLELRRELSTSVYDSITSASAGSDSVYRTMQGIKEWLRYTTGTNLKNPATAENLSPEILESMLQDVWEDGGMPNTVVGHIRQTRQISNFYKDQVRYAPSDQVRGSFVKKFMSGQGFELEIRPNLWIARHELAVLDMSRLFLVPYRDLVVKSIAPTGDSQKWQMVGEYTLELRNPAESHAFHQNLVVPN